MEARYEEIALALHRATHANETDVRRYEIWRGAEPGSYYTLESFDDELGFITHQTSDHHEEFGPQFRELFESTRFEWVDPVQGGSPLAPTNRTPLPADASELAAAYYERMGVVVQEWWQPLR